MNDTNIQIQYSEIEQSEIEQSEIKYYDNNFRDENRINIVEKSSKTYDDILKSLNFKLNNNGNLIISSSSLEKKKQQQQQQHNDIPKGDTFHPPFQGGCVIKINIFETRMITLSFFLSYNELKTKLERCEVSSPIQMSCAAIQMNWDLVGMERAAHNNKTRRNSQTA